MHRVSGGGADDRLAELGPDLERTAHGAGAGDLLQPRDLLLADIVSHMDGDVEGARRRTVVEVDIDRHIAQLPALRPRINDQRRRHAGRHRSRHQLVRRGSSAIAAQSLRLVRDQAVATVDNDLLAERAGDRSCCRSQTHRCQGRNYALVAHQGGRRNRCGQLRNVKEGSDCCQCSFRWSEAT